LSPAFRVKGNPLPARATEHDRNGLALTETLRQATGIAGGFGIATDCEQPPARTATEASR